MILEAQIEQNILSSIESIDELSSYQIVTSRQVGDQIADIEEANTSGVIAIASGFRANDQFSLSPITINFTITVATRVETDSTSEIHEKAIEAIADKLSYWHKYGNQMSQALSTQKVLVGELRMDGGTGRTYDKVNSIWSESISFSLRGSEKFNN